MRQPYAAQWSVALRCRLARRTHVLSGPSKQDVDGRVKPGHDEIGIGWPR